MQWEQTVHLCINVFCYWICCFAVIALLFFSSTGGVTYCIVFPMVWFYCEVHLNFVKMKWSACHKTSVGRRKNLSPRQEFFFSVFKIFFLCLMLKTCWSFHFHICFTKLNLIFTFLHLNIEFALYKFILLIIMIIIIIILINTII